jgi:N-methylhydantoinase B
MGLRRVVRPVGHDCDFNGAGERFINPPWGVFGGQSGGTGRFAVVRAASGTGGSEADKVIIETPGAGGYGDPALRTADDIARDAQAGKTRSATTERPERQP